MSMQPHGRDLYARHTDVNGKTSVQMHRVWDVDTFIGARRRDCEKANADQKDGQPRKAAIEQITRDQYLKERQARQ